VVEPYKAPEPYKGSAIRPTLQHQKSESLYDTYEPEPPSASVSSSTYSNTDPYNSTVTVDVSVVRLPVVAQESLEEQTIRLQKDLASSLPAQVNPLFPLFSLFFFLSFFHLDFVD